MCALKPASGTIVVSVQRFDSVVETRCDYDGFALVRLEIFDVTNTVGLYAMNRVFDLP